MNPLMLKQTRGYDVSLGGVKNKLLSGSSKIGDIGIRGVKGFVDVTGISNESDPTATISRNDTDTTGDDKIINDLKSKKKLTTDEKKLLEKLEKNKETEATATNLDYLMKETRILGSLKDGSVVSWDVSTGCLFRKYNNIHKGSVIAMDIVQNVVTKYDTLEAKIEAENATTLGVVLLPSAFSIICGSFPLKIDTHELVVPKSIPITLLIFFSFIKRVIILNLFSVQIYLSYTLY